jgi:hypothetical protein
MFRVFLSNSLTFFLSMQAVGCNIKNIIIIIIMKKKNVSYHKTHVSTFH